MNFATNKVSPDEQKLRGGYYTPIPLARYLCEWAIRDGGERVLEPSVGDGNFLLALDAANNSPDPLRVTAIELDECELDKAKRRTENADGIEVAWRRGDFFEEFGKIDRKFDVVLGNPPFIRFQYFDPESRETAFEHLRSFGYKPTKLANAWAAFVQLSIEALRPGGRLAMVIPAELLQVKYAEELRDRLTQMFEHVVLVTFQRLVFEGIQQEVVLVLAEGKREEPSDHALIHTIEFADADELFGLRSITDAIAHAPDKHARRDVKWTALFLDEQAFANLQSAHQSKGVKQLGELARVEVGIVTGRNSFFVLEKERAAAMQLNGHSQQLVGRTSSLRSITFRSSDFEAHSDKHPSVLLDLNGVDSNKIKGPLASYIRLGEEQGVHEGYKCSIRKRWFDVPSIYRPDAFLFRQIHDAPLLVANETQATSTDTIHRVRLKQELSPRQLAASFCNSLTFAWAEVCGRSYGGGVLELEPREAEELPIPFAALLHVDADKVDSILRSDGLIAALDYTDPILLGDGLGLSVEEILSIRGCWIQLRDRRKNRRHAPKRAESKPKPKPQKTSLAATA
ncbi:N-6 DNA methylase [Altererythrobacter lutimaris]|uniref:site-specific DNA-methyltransferase (adenine-specific) n=1 Tax=Altererythrobacter lutimaris TaxID=2743979 RepID=A0A850HEF7_9SPHN|nr:N-6 DNA methylase [Altererythrobacter lutimaris]NVE95895.1 N-6 DNA methylase [Altererythrobacter lutimaris]